MTELPAIDIDVPFERVALEGGSWFDIARGWLRGADALYAHLESTVMWQQGRVWRYERHLEEPRLGAVGTLRNPHHPVLADAQLAIQARYKARFDGFGLQYYRNARDSVALHRDREMRWLDDTIVAILTTGARRPFLVQPRRTHGASTAQDLAPGPGDLMVFGGRFQADYLHGVPKVRHAVRGRISVQWRYTTGRGKPEMTPGYYAPREFSKPSRARR
ncbi:MAG TPA: alpha-ketoglutarate-dependent dioxygenase AlkB [Acidimicrobiia bacterium]|nr:alpha-ketoglutarate-dependent dioxygenase AlkB [Acidimicrobiia bacterium]